MELPPERFCGHVVDADGFRLEVWGVYHPGDALPFAISLNYEASQLFTFTYGQAGNDELFLDAERVVRGEAKVPAVTQVLVPQDEESVIDEADTVVLMSEWRGRNG